MRYGGSHHYTAADGAAVAGGAITEALMADGIGKLAAVYVISLFGFVIWVGLLISWLFFHGVKPPLA
ncbi:hypothetical protein PCA20602_04380 [Pandoraea capi]|uniref:Uncharacterized protein n=1 Tax=Pandoraea capi TaxID=2508286 RepID=A0ABY6WBN8_9BURK|nr:hypothetical protein [Pandoraea capi]VVE45215.1 hypothetical protein PCA20602_04380 [Pandoraea capi]